MAGDIWVLVRWKKPVAMGVFMAPALAINITHGVESDRPAAYIFAAAMCVVASAVCGERFISQDWSLSKILNGFILAVLLAFNFSNAIGLAASHRDSVTGDAKTLQAKREIATRQIAAIERQLAAVERTLQGRSVSRLKSDIAALELHHIYTRTDQCQNVTIDPSRAHCAKLTAARALLADAERAATLRRELQAANTRLANMRVVRSTDPQAESVLFALRFIGLTHLDTQTVQYILTLIFAAAIEMTAAFGASWVGHQRQHQPSIVTTRTPEAPSATDDDAQDDTDAESALTHFLARLTSTTKHKITFADLYAEYVRIAQMAGEPVESQRKVGLELSDRFRKTKGGDVAYYVKLKPDLQLVKTQMV